MAATVRELLKEGTRRLSRVVADNPQLASEYLLRWILKLRKIDLYLEPEREMTAGQVARFWDYVSRKIEREPLQYILGETEWFGLVLRCDPRALIPRPETEIIAERAVELLRGVESPLIADIGTGTGAIAIALADALPGASVVATDISESALELAGENIAAFALSERVELRLGSLLDPLGSNGLYDLIISNPPYVRTGEYTNLMSEVRDHEPSQALVAGEDGLDVIRELITRAPDYLKSGAWLVLEFGINHAEKIKELAGQTSSFETPLIVMDYNQQERGVILRRL